jgi:hypothetical protein
MCDIDLEPCEVWKESKVKAARKAHTCSCCHGPINVGEPYTKLFVVYEGEAESEKSCKACDDDVATFMADHTMRGVPSLMPDLYQQCVDESEDEGDAENAEKYRRIIAENEARAR